MTDTLRQKDKKLDGPSIAVLQATPSVWTRAAHSLVKAKWPLVAVILLGTMILIALIGPSIAPKDPNRQSLLLRLKAPLVAEEDGSIEFLLGTDALGRDVLSRLIYGARISISVGFVAVAIGGTMGTCLGLVSGYFGGRIDDIIMRLADIQLAFPFILLAIMVLVV